MILKLQKLIIFAGAMCFCWFCFFWGLGKYRVIPRYALVMCFGFLTFGTAVSGKLGKTRPWGMMVSAYGGFPYTDPFGWW